MTDIYRFGGVALTILNKIMGYTTISTSPGQRSVFINGYTGASANTKTIGFVTILNGANASYFGDSLTSIRVQSSTSNGSNNRGVSGGGYSTSTINVIEYITISSHSNSADRNDLTVARNQNFSTSNGVNNRGIFAGGGAAVLYNTIDYITISSTGDATDFGDLSAVRQQAGAVSNGVNNRGVFAGGDNTGGTPTRINTIEYITISSAGNTTPFGILSVNSSAMSGTSNGTNDRGIFAGFCIDVTGATNIIEYITISTTSNSSDFGDLTTTNRDWAGSGSSNGVNNRGIFAGGGQASASNVIDYVSISSIGNATDFGDLYTTLRYLNSTSNA